MAAMVAANKQPMLKGWDKVNRQTETDLIYIFKITVENSIWK